MEKAQEKNVKETKRQLDLVLFNSIDHEGIHQAVMEYGNEFLKKE